MTIQSKVLLDLLVDQAGLHLSYIRRWECEGGESYRAHYLYHLAAFKQVEEEIGRLLNLYKR